MVQRLVDLALRLQFIVLATTALLLAAGLAAYRELDIEAYPNPVPPMVDIITQPEGWSAEEVERYITIPLEIGLAGMPGLDHVRSQSLFGLSDIKCYFKWSIKYDQARQEVINRLQFIHLPNDIAPTLSPWNAIGELFRYTLRGKGYSLRDLKTAEDWVLERQFKQVPGVIDVVSFGGESKQYHVAVDPFRLRGQGQTLTQLMDAIQHANKNVGGQRLVIGEQAYTVRGIGILRNVHDIEDVVVSERNGVPTRVKDVATAEVGSAQRLGIVGQDDSPDVIQGVVLMRYGGQTARTLEGIHSRVEHIEKNNILSPGMEIVPYYDRGNLVRLTTHTVLENLLVGMLLVSVVLYHLKIHHRMLRVEPTQRRKRRGHHRKPIGTIAVDKPRQHRKLRMAFCHLRVGDFRHHARAQHERLDRSEAEAKSDRCRSPLRHVRGQSHHEHNGVATLLGAHRRHIQGPRVLLDRLLLALDLNDYREHDLARGIAKLQDKVGSELDGEHLVLSGLHDGH
ncbi:MAG: efflux RND transporter permease subunit, partial [Myxococcales bacterium]